MTAGWRFALATAALTLLFAVAAVASATERVDYPRGVVEAARWAWAVAAGVAFVAGYRAAEGVSLAAIVVAAGLLVTTALCVEPFHSTDLYTYINRGWQQDAYGVNPYIVTVAETPGAADDPMFLSKWQHNPSPYGFLFMLEARAVATIAGRDYALTVRLYKAAAVGTFVALGGVLWAGMAALKLHDRPQRLYLFACNPLVLLHHVGHGHNDLQMVLGVAAAVWAIVAGWWLVALPALAAGVLMKIPAVVVVPVLTVTMVRRFGVARTAASAALALTLVAVTAWPYLPGILAHRDAAARVDITHSMHNSLAALAHYPLELVRKSLPWGHDRDDPSRAVVRGLAWLLLAVLLMRQAWRRFRVPAGDRGVARDAAFAMTAAVLCSPKFHAWYVGWAVPLVVWLPARDWLRRAGLALGVGNLFAITALYQAHAANALTMIAAPVAWALRRQGRTRRVTSTAGAG